MRQFALKYKSQKDSKAHRNLKKVAKN